MPERIYYTYIMASRGHTLYIGVTSNLHKRVFQHKWKECGGFTARYSCDRLVGFERHHDIAIAREKELKDCRRSKKIDLIESMNPAWAGMGRPEPRLVRIRARRLPPRPRPHEHLTAHPSARSPMQSRPEAQRRDPRLFLLLFSTARPPPPAWPLRRGLQANY
jgi:putative endonuclease